jgi:hypothetical protein
MLAGSLLLLVLLLHLLVLLLSPPCCSRVLLVRSHVTVQQQSAAGLHLGTPTAAAAVAPAHAAECLQHADADKGLQRIHKGDVRNPEPHVLQLKRCVHQQLEHLQQQQQHHLLVLGHTGPVAATGRCMCPPQPLNTENAGIIRYQSFSVLLLLGAFASELQCRPRLVCSVTAAAGTEHSSQYPTCDSQ